MLLQLSAYYKSLDQSNIKLYFLSCDRCIVFRSISTANNVRLANTTRIVGTNMDRDVEGTELTQINRRRSTSVHSERTRPPPLRTMSEASVYRANSRQRITIKNGVNQDNKTLDRLMECFWTCSPGCHQTS
uniref:Uncharacterized protein n=1 Tax=Lygus hesperus TaxID=30085 RepID=A0A0A9YFI0_LYGHE